MKMLALPNDRCQSADRADGARFCDKLGTVDGLVMLVTGALGSWGLFAVSDEMLAGEEVVLSHNGATEHR
jgi:hypothetical protein